MVVTRSINSQNITRSKAGQTYHHLQLLIPEKRKRSQKPTSTENVSKTIPVVYDYEPKYWIEEETQPIYSSLEGKPEIKQEDFTKDDESVITEVEDLLRHQKQIDFDEAHDAWMENKKRNAYGCYVYLCGKPLKTGKKCRNAQFDKSGCHSGCKTHNMWEEKESKFLWQ
jgi:hypothetical protein